MDHAVGEKSLIGGVVSRDEKCNLILIKANRAGCRGRRRDLCQGVKSIGCEGARATGQIPLAGDSEAQPDDDRVGQLLLSWARQQSLPRGGETLTVGAR